MDSQSRAHMPEAAESPREGDWFGQFRILEKLGEGGFGAVYRAQQSTPVLREVALKVLRQGLAAEDAVARFELERQALALMDHPGIATVLDAGVMPDGQPWFAMQLVRGVPVTTYCDRARLGIAERLQLFARICDAVVHAHQKGVIHRDLKPSNVLVTEQDGSAQPVIIDFGIARLARAAPLERPQLTQSFQILGTLEYMAPEQASGRARDVDTRADVYALGVLLYELTTGSKPFELAALLEHGYDELLRVVRDVDPLRPSARVEVPELPSTAAARSRNCTPGALARELRGDLDWIVMKALEKERERRYDGVGALAADVRRHLAHEPVSASPPSRLYRLRKLVRRHRGGVVAAAAIVTLFLAGGVGTGVGFARARDAAERAGTEATRYRRVFTLVEDMLEGVKPRVALGEDTRLLRAVLDRTRERVDADAAARLGRVDDEVELTMRRLLAGAYLDLREARAARANAERALELSRTLYGAGDVRTADAVVTLASVRYEQGEYAQASASLPGAIRVLESAPREEHALALARAWIELGNHLREQSCFDEAGDALERGLAIAGADPRGAELEANAALNLGKVHTELAESELALFRHEQALALYRRTFGEDSAQVAMALGSVGRAHLDLGQREAAGAFLEEALARIRRYFGPTHTTLAAAIHNLARFYKQEGRFAEAEPLYLEVIAIDRARSPDGSRDLVSSMHNIAGLYRALGRREESGKYLEAVFEMRSRLRLEVDRDHAVSLVSLGLYLEESGRAVEAAQRLAEALELLTRFLGAAHPNVATTTLYLARTRHASGDRDGAASAAELAVARTGAAFGERHKVYLDSTSLLAAIDLERGRATEAVDGYRRVLERVRDKLGPDDASLAACEFDLGRALQCAGDLEQAGELLRAAWARLERDPGHARELRVRCARQLASHSEARGDAPDAARWRARAEAEER